MKANNRVAPSKEEQVVRSKKKGRKTPTYFWVGLFFIILLLLATALVAWQLIGQRADFVPHEAYPKMLGDDTYLVQVTGAPDPHLETLEVQEVQGGVLVTWRWVIAPEPGTQYSLVARTWDQRVGGKEKPIVSVAVTSHQVLIPLDGRAISHAGVEVHYGSGMESGGNLPINSKKY